MKNYENKWTIDEWSQTIMVNVYRNALAIDRIPTTTTNRKLFSDFNHYQLNEYISSITLPNEWRTKMEIKTPHNTSIYANGEYYDIYYEINDHLIFTVIASLGYRLVFHIFFHRIFFYCFSFILLICGSDRWHNDRKFMYRFG